MQPGHPTLVQQFPIYPRRTPAYQKTNRVRNTVLRRDARAQVNVVVHRMPFQQLYPFLLMQLPQVSAYCCPRLAIDDLP